MVNNMLPILSEEILSVSLLRSNSMLSQVRTLVGCHTSFSELIIKPALVNEFKRRVYFSRVFSKVLSISRPSSKKQTMFMELNLQYFANYLPFASISVLVCFRASTAPVSCFAHNCSKYLLVWELFFGFG